MSDQLTADRFALQDVLLKYAAGVDERDMDLYRSCFTDDVEVLGFSEEAVHGADAWLNFVTEALENYGPTQHMLGPQLATVDGDTAHARTDLQALHYLKEAEDTTQTVWATFESDLRRVDGEWKIFRHRLVRRGTRIQSG